MRFIFNRIDAFFLLLLLVCLSSNKIGLIFLNPLNQWSNHVKMYLFIVFVCFKPIDCKQWPSIESSFLSHLYSNELLSFSLYWLSKWFVIFYRIIDRSTDRQRCPSSQTDDRTLVDLVTSCILSNLIKSNWIFFFFFVFFYIRLSWWQFGRPWCKVNLCLLERCEPNTAKYVVCFELCLRSNTIVNCRNR